MAFRAVLDACVLYPFSLRDLLLRLADIELYDPYWSQRILEEVTRNLVDNEAMPAHKAERLAATMRAAFDAAEVPELAIVQLEPAMTNHPKDRHVLAAAVAAHAQAVVTHNLSDFAPEDCEPLGIKALHPDEFLLVLYDKRPEQLRRTLREQAGDLTSPPVELPELLDMLSKAVPRFVNQVRTDLRRTA